MLELVRRRPSALLLLVFVAVGFALRLYHVDFPSIGYHNMKENHTFFEAQSMLDSGDLLRTEVWWYGLERDGIIHDQPPVLAWMTALVWKIVGVRLDAARLIVIAFSVGSIPLIHALALRLGAGTQVSLAGAFLFAVAPLPVFFGRNVQPEAPATFFMLLSWLLFLRFCRDFRERDFVGFAASLAASVVLKSTFLLMALPLLALVPYRRLASEPRATLRRATVVAAFLMPVPLWMGLQRALVPEPAGSIFWKLAREGAIAGDIGGFFAADTRRETLAALASYGVENFGPLLPWIAAVGLVLCAPRWRDPFERFCLASSACFTVYVVLLAGYVAEHSYYQMPFAPLVCLLGAYSFQRAADAAAGLAGAPRLRLVGLALPLLLVPGFGHSRDRMWDTIYYGEDVIGEFIRAQSGSDERFFAAGHRAQLAGIGWHAQRRYKPGVPDDAAVIARAERELGFRWVVVHGRTARAFDKHMGELRAKTHAWDHIRRSYGIRQVGYLRSAAGELAPIYIILEKGGRFDLGAMGGSAGLVRSYDTKRGRVDLFAQTRRAPTGAER